MPYTVYKLIHFLGIFTLLSVLAASGMHILRGGVRGNNPHRRTLGTLHGIASFLILVGGFGMLARLGIIQAGLPTWVYAKLTIWLVLSGAVAVVNRGPAAAQAVMLLSPLLALLAAGIAVYKP